MASIAGGRLVLISTEIAQPEIDVAALVETYSRLLFHVAHSVLRSRTEAEDVVQDAFLRVMEHRNSLDAIRDMRVWLVRIAWNLALDRRRCIRPEQIDESFAESLAADAMSAEARLEQAQRMRSVLREIERLPSKERQVLLLSAIEELGTAEIAKILGRSESAVRALLFRARTRLRERLEALGGKR
jgi:RNA polymerase sigma-70 factor (ECF subfamily)